MTVVLRRRVLRLLSVVLFAAFLAAGCGEPAEKVDPCKTITCDRGVCNSAIGDCSNPGVCIEDDECLEGYACTPEGACEADFPCGEGQICDRGVCERGACVDPDMCQDNSECVAGHVCVDGACDVDPCVGVTCDAGVCDVRTGECTNKSFCTEETEAEDCVDGFYCKQQTCQSEADICEDVTCPRGVCDAATEDCTNASSCQEDTECIDGFYCNEEGVCEENQCDLLMVMCDRGVCEGSSGICKNAEMCTAAEECLDAFSCVQGDCVVAGTECGEDCPGNMACEYDPVALDGTCEENPDGCSRAIDCMGERICRDGACQEPTACEDDSHEPNDSTATPYFDAVTDGTVDASICSQDTDLFTYHTDDDPDFTGDLIVDLRYEPEDVGLGDLMIELLDPDGTVVEETTGTNGGNLRLRHAVSVTQLGEYTVRVSDPGGVTTAGVRYSLYVDLLDSTVAQACAQATDLASGDSISGNTSSGASYTIGSSCTSDDNDAGEDIYRIEVTEPVHAEFVLEPTTNSDLSMSVRERCELAVSELACADEVGAGNNEALRKILEPGEYFLVVQGDGAGSGGPYDLSYVGSPTICTPSDDHCADPDTAEYCNSTGTGFVTESCSSGCDSSRGRCNRLPADVCYTAIDATTGYSGTIDWSTLQADYDPGVTGCVPAASGSSTETDGPDAAYRVDMPADSVLQAELDRVSGDYVSLYLVTDCQNVQSSCIMGVNSGRYDDESMTYFNDTGAMKTVYVIADIEDDFSYGTTDIDITVSAVTCTPLSTQCVGDDLETCDSLGTGWTAQTCTFGCNMGACEPVTNDVCSGAIDLIGTGGTFTGRIDEYVDDYNPGFSGCTGSSASGSDAVFEITGAVGDVATVEVDSSFDASLWVTTDCASAASSCVVGADSVGSGSTEMTQFVIESGKTYYAIVDGFSSISGDFTITASTQAPSCTPGDIIGCTVGDTLEYCSGLGIPTDYTCSTTCTGQACDAPTGEVCPDAIPLADGDTDHQDYDTPNNMNPGVGQVGQCSFGSGEEPDGADHVYRIDMTAGEYLMADFTSTSSYGILYLLRDCFDFDTCQSNTADGTSGSLTYQAPIDETVYLVMDRTLSGTSTLNYDLSVTVRAPDCTPGQPSVCQSDNQTKEYCDSFGFTQTYQCSTTCSFGECDQPTGDVCADPIVLQSGDSVTGDWSGTNHLEPESPRDGQCFYDSGNQPDGRDTIYRVDLFAGDLLQADLTTTNSNAYVYVLEGCSDTSTCAAGNYDEGSATVYHHAESDGPVYLVVDSSNSTSSTTSYTLDVNVISGAVCAPDDTRCAGANTLEVCNSAGTAVEQTFTCPAGCVNGACEVELPSADTCGTAPDVGNGIFVYSSYDQLNDDVSISSSGCSQSSGVGPDLTYAVTVDPGEVLHAAVKSYGNENPHVYVVSDCANPDSSCVAGGAADSNDFADTYYAPQQTETVYVVADATSSFSDEPFSLLIEVLPQQCSPGQQLCTGSDVLEYCNGYGLFDTYRCDGTCDASTNRCANPTGDVCIDAIPLSADGGTYSGDYGSFTDQLNPGSGTCILRSSDAPDGPDAVFAVDLNQGDVLTAALTTTTSNSSLYVLESCGGDEASACLYAEPDSQVLDFYANQTKTYYLVVDSDDASETASFTLDLSRITNAICQPDAARCDSSTSTQTVCDSTGQNILTSYTCDYGCANGEHCAGPPAANDTCATSYDVSGSVQILDTYSRFADDYDPGTSSCLSDAADGPDAVYGVNIGAGEVLRATVTASNSGDDPGVYVVSDCSDVSTYCLSGNISNNPEITTYYASAAGEFVYVMVDSDSSYDDDPYIVDLDVTPQQCTPGTVQCQDSTSLEICNEYGIWDDPYTCQGGCNVGSGTCVTPTGNICADAKPMTSGDSDMQDFDGSNDIALGTGQVGSCSFASDDDGVGIDHFYEVDLLAGETLTTSFTTNSSYGIMYIMGDCFDPSTCIDNTSRGSSGTLSYTATVDETVIVVMDRALSGSTTFYDYTIDFTIN